MKFAVQLYSLRDYIARHGLEDAFRIVSEAGFEGVEFAGFYEKSETEIETLLARYGLKAVSAHVGVEQLHEQLPMLLSLGISCAIVPWMPFNMDMTYAEGLEKLQSAERLVKQHGLSLGYHNHAHEFKDGTDVLSDLVRDMPSLKLEPDMFWLAVAGVDGEAFLRKNGERLVYLHIKELGEGGAEGENPVVGAGKANLSKAIEIGKEFGVGWAILEAEKVGIPMDEYLKRSCAFMKKYQ